MVVGEARHLTAGCAGRCQVVFVSYPRCLIAERTEKCGSGRFTQEDERHKGAVGFPTEAVVPAIFSSFFLRWMIFVNFDRADNLEVIFVFKRR